MKRTITSIYILLCSISIVFAQKTSLEIRADRAFHIFDYSDAIHFYTSSGSLSPESARNLASAYFKTNRFAECVATYETKLKDIALSPDERYTYILALQSAGKTDSALQALKAFAQAYPGDLRSISYQADKADFAAIRTNNPDVQVSNLDLNTPDDDFGPAYCNNQIVYASTQKKYLLVKRNYLWNQRNFLNLFAADRQNGQLINAKRFPFNQNKKWHEADACFFHNGNSMAFTQDSYKERATDKSVNLKIFFSEKVDGKWASPTPFSINNKDFSVGHPSLSEDGNTLFFASNMPGGFGGTDIYKVSKNADGSWSKPLNLGPSVNTEGNELFPFWHETSQSLYFASNGRFGLGGLDVFVSECYGDNNWEPAFNLGAPINSEFDDFSLVLQSNNKDGFFTSNRLSGKGGDDLYAYFNAKPEKPTAQVDLLVLDQQTGQPIPNATAHLQDAQKPTDSAGHVRFDLKDGSYSFSAEAVAYQPSAPKALTVKAKRRGPNVLADTLYLNLAVAEKVRLNNIYYDFDRWDILPVSALELNKVAELLKTHPGMHVELSSHTDARGNTKYNLKLSQLRADAAKNYIVAKGIDPARITATGFGKSKLLNTSPDCTPEQHRQNRRTELFIPDYGQGENPPQASGDYLDGQPDHGKGYSSYKAHGSIYKITLPK